MLICKSIKALPLAGIVFFSAEYRSNPAAWLEPWVGSRPRSERSLTWKSTDKDSRSCNRSQTCFRSST